MTAEEQIARLEEQLTHVLEQLRLKDEQLQVLQEQLRVAQARIEELEKQKTPPAPFVKANVAKPKAEQKQPKKREAKHNHGRPREAPTLTVDHLIKYCPVCTSALGGISVARRRQVIELPPPPPVEVTEHVVFHGWCSQCGTWREAPLDVSREVVGQGRFGVKIASLITYLRTVMRLPVRQIQAYLASLHDLSISSGEIIGLAQRVKAQLEPQLAKVKQQIRAAQPCRWMKRGGEKMGAMAMCGVPVRRTCAITSIITRAARRWSQRCWVQASRGSWALTSTLPTMCIWDSINEARVHLLRDRHELKEQHPDDADVQQWARDVKAVYDRAVAYAGPDPSLPPAKQKAARRTLQHAFEQELWRLCAPYAHTSSPLHTLCERVERFLPELFVFVAVPGVPAENNLAERSVRPLVIARKISGGTRSPAGSDTRMGLFSLFGTWAAQGLNPFLQCLAVLSQNESLSQM